ncbi:folylpolyglutamate synthase/dihydrofolate synthase family protein [Cryobacterium sp. BB736]|uniref:bifunctional folylpolyglutamate synthase/dihydrofolate synthase n=1 Tax=Cryobacterium sp. BB736 TaxID=2746963 RepID=UPI0018767A5A|nr:folylpolyglutamate synthase/dihydrofolate synthase family protein [Cryobacterium sp. BB736]
MSARDDDPELSDDALFQSQADRVYAELLARVGESAPQPRLEPTRRAAELLGDPQKAFGMIHITGTNGKTSTSRITESILRAHGLRTGLFTSPHLSRVNERIMIDGEPISNEALVTNWDDITPYLKMADEQLVAEGEEPLTYFEALTLLAYASFADAPVDVAVVEVGMGGEWDSTNIADGQVAVFTPIALDHVHRLGDTIAEIAETKAGIIKPGARIVTAAQHPDAADAIIRAAASNNGTIAAEGRDFGLESATVGVGGQLITAHGIAGRYEEVFLPLLGDHQAQNAAVAIAAVESFLGGGEQRIGEDVLAEGLATATSPGRLQLLGIEPSVLVDAAHNPHGAEALAAAIGKYFDFRELALVVGILADKDAHGIVDTLAPLATRIHVTQSHSDRAIPADELADDVEQWTHETVIRFDTLEEALDAAREWAGLEQGRAVLVTGSITLVGEAIDIGRDQGWAL